jgi:peptidoglycan/xylan/chitin deacetylase (PgdA/CDA1 family)
MAVVSGAVILAFASALSLSGPALADGAPDPSSSTPVTDTSTTPEATPSTAPAPDPSPSPSASPAAPVPAPAPSPEASPPIVPQATAPVPQAAPAPTPGALNAPLVVAAAVPPAPQTVISLTFDDDNADQVGAAAVLNAAGMHGTFFTNSGTVGQPGQLTRADLSALYAAGNEIGGHTVNHPDLTTLPASEVQRQICLDRDNLLAWGFPVQSFAYPFASTNASIDAVAKACGYNSARNLGDLQTRFGCAGCEYAESIPPANAYETAGLDEVDSTWTLADFESAVTNAEMHGGGWVQFTFHHYCDNGCDPLAVTSTTFSQFVTWLSTRATTNNTVVKTVAQVVGGTTKPAVVVAPATSSATVTNPSLETAGSTGLPSCWSQAGYGTNTATFDTVAPGHTGSVAGRLTMSSYTDGDQKIMPTLDLGTCTPSVTSGTSYQLSGWYTSTANTQFEVYLRTTSGAWVYWDASPYFTPATAWTPATWTTQTVPAGYDGIDFGLSLFSLGVLDVDDYALTPTALPLVTTATVTPAAPNGSAGWYTVAPAVTLSVPADSVPTTTQYSLDGGTTWLTYSTPVTISAAHTTFAYRSTTATQVEATRSLTFAVDAVAPTISATYNPVTRSYSATASDATSGVAVIQQRPAGGAWTTYTGPTVLGAGSVSLELRAVDVAGNVSASTFIAAPPITTATVAPATATGLAGWYTVRPLVTLSAGTPGVDQVTQYSYEGVTWLTYTSPISVPDGTWTLRYRSMGAGFVEATHSLSLRVDATPPVVVPGFNAAARMYSATASDATSGVASIQQRAPGGPWTAYAPQLVGTGAFSLEFRATDAAGNVSSVVPLSIPAVGSLTVTVAPPAPDGTAGWYVTRPRVTLGVGAGQTAQYSVGGGAWRAYTGAISVAAGVSTLSFRGIVGGQPQAIQTRSFSVDTTNPVVHAVLSTKARTVTATVTAGRSPVAFIQWRAAGGQWANYTKPIAVGAAATSLSFRAIAVSGRVSATVTTAVPKAQAAAKAVTLVKLAITPKSATSHHKRVATAHVMSSGKKLSGKVTFCLDGKVVKSVKLVHGKATLKLTRVMKVGKHSIRVSYAGNAVSKSRTVAATFKVKRHAATVHDAESTAR